MNGSRELQALTGSPQGPTYCLRWAEKQLGNKERWLTPAGVQNEAARKEEAGEETPSLAGVGVCAGTARGCCVTVSVKTLVAWLKIHPAAPGLRRQPGGWSPALDGGRQFSSRQIKCAFKLNPSGFAFHSV